MYLGIESRWQGSAIGVAESVQKRSGVSVGDVPATNGGNVGSFPTASCEVFLTGGGPLLAALFLLVPRQDLQDLVPLRRHGAHAIVAGARSGRETVDGGGG